MLVVLFRSVLRPVYVAIGQQTTGYIYGPLTFERKHPFEIFHDFRRQSGPLSYETCSHSHNLHCESARKVDGLFSYKDKQNLANQKC